MIYRRLGRTATKVSELCLGTMTFGREVDETGAASLVRRFVEAGGNFIDTADVYKHGVSESFGGSAIKAFGVPRDETRVGIRGCFHRRSDTHRRECLRPQKSTVIPGNPP
jgi:aryl-alcohol dehydrogenase-like predicted oxidoreductase